MVSFSSHIDSAASFVSARGLTKESFSHGHPLGPNYSQKPLMLNHVNTMQYPTRSVTNLRNQPIVIRPASPILKSQFQSFRPVANPTSSSFSGGTSIRGAAAYGLMGCQPHPILPGQMVKHLYPMNVSVEHAYAFSKFPRSPQNFEPRSPNYDFQSYDYAKANSYSTQMPMPPVLSQQVGALVSKSASLIGCSSGNLVPSTLTVRPQSSTTADDVKISPNSSSIIVIPGNQSGPAADVPGPMLVLQQHKQSTPIQG